jgi:hypothetical protein
MVLHTWTRDLRFHPLCARHVVDGVRRHEFEGHRAGVPEARQAMAISSRLAVTPA